jgi:hypothetical protein
MPAKKAVKAAPKAAIKVPKTLNVASSPKSSLSTIMKNVEVALGKVGCRGCRSGIDKIIIGDLVQKGIK